MYDMWSTHVARAHSVHHCVSVLSGAAFTKPI